MTNILPSPTWPVCADRMIVSSTVCSLASDTTTSILILGTKSTVYSVPRYISVWPFWRPKPRTSVMVMPGDALLGQGVLDVFELEMPDDCFHLLHRRLLDLCCGRTVSRQLRHAEIRLQVRDAANRAPLPAIAGELPVQSRSLIPNP